MTQRAYPLNDTNYTAEDVRLFHVARCTGIFNVFGNDLQVQASSGMNVNVLPGYAFLLTSSTEKTGGFTYGSDAIEPLTVDVAGSTDRYDYVSVRYSKTTNKAIIMYVKGSGTRPTVPVRNKNEYEIILAIVHVRGNAAEIKGSDIIDCRLDEKYCGVVVDGTDRLDTSGFSQEFRSYMDQIKNVVDSNAAGNLLNEINNIKSNEQKPNLLVNSDFKSGIVNQKGKIVYANSGSYAIDMWMNRNTSSKVSVLENSIKFEVVSNSNNDTYVNFSQAINKKDLLGQEVTLSINVKSVTKSWRFGIYSANAVHQPSTKIGEFTINKTGITNVVINIPQSISEQYLIVAIVGDMKKGDILNVGDFIEVSQIKLEKGSLFTGMPYFSYAIELLKCQRYFLSMTLNVQEFVSNNAGIQKTFLFPTPMVNQPSFKIVKENQKNNVSSVTAEGDWMRMVWNIHPAKAGVITIFDQVIECDANEY